LSACTCFREYAKRNSLGWRAVRREYDDSLRQMAAHIFKPYIKSQQNICKDRNTKIYVGGKRNGISGRQRGRKRQRRGREDRMGEKAYKKTVKQAYPALDTTPIYKKIKKKKPVSRYK